MRAAWLTLRHAAALLGHARKLWFPFLVAACCEVVLIGLLWLAPHPPYASLLAPPIAYVFGERVLHYPWHLRFLYAMMQYTHLASATLVGAFMSGVVCVMVRQAHDGTPISFRTVLVNRSVRYGTVLMLWLLTASFAAGASTAAMHLLGHSGWALPVQLGVTLAVQMACLYWIPASVFEQLRWWSALRCGVRETFRHPLSTAIVVLVPSAAVISFAFLASDARVSRWMAKTEPEIVVLFIAARLAVLTVADAIMTVSAAQLWWVHRAPRQISQAAETSVIGSLRVRAA